MTDAAHITPVRDGIPSGWLYGHVPRPRLTTAGNVRPARPERILVFVKGDNASFDYYLSARLRLLGVPYEVRCIDRDGMDGIDADGLLVIVCRYIGPRQVKWIARNRNRMAGVAYFVDDDIAALVTDSQSNLDYRLYLAYFACLPMKRLSRSLTHLWVSTEALARTLSWSQGGKAAVLGPAPVIEDHFPLERPHREAAVRIAYHATNTHRREHAFLVPVVEEVMRRRPDVRFEVLAQGRSENLWKSAAIASERITVLPPTDWQEYQRHSREEGADIALMPLIEGLANASRADTKLIDCYRMGAASLMSDVAPYRRSRGSGAFMVENSPEKWIEGLLALIDQADRRDAARHATRNLVLAMKTPAHPFPEVCGPGAREAAP